MTVNIISIESGIMNVLDVDSRSVGNNITYQNIPEDDHWKVEFLREAMAIRNGDLLLDNFERKEIQTIINCIASM